MAKNVPDFEDANLVLRLYEERREPVLREARQWFVESFAARDAAEFTRKYPAGSDGNRMFRMVSSYWDMVGAIVLSGVLNPELLFRTSREQLLVWERVRPFVGELRTARKDPLVLKNLEGLAEANYRWLDQQSEGLSQTLAARFRAMADEAAARGR